MDKLGDYGKALVTLTSRVTMPKTKRAHKELEKAFENTILDLEGPRRIQKGTFSPREIFVSRLFSGFIEIHESLERLRSFKVYISRYPYSGTKITKGQYLRYTLENYLHEFYILKERVKSYINTIDRLYKKDVRYSKISSELKPLAKVISAVFDDLLKARGIHVHQNRYTDSDIDRLGTLEFFAQNAKDIMPEMDILYEIHYKEMRRKWKETISLRNNYLEKALNIIFEKIYSVIFTKNGNARYPKNYRKT